LMRFVVSDRFFLFFLSPVFHLSVFCFMAPRSRAVPHRA